METTNDQIEKPSDVLSICYNTGDELEPVEALAGENVVVEPDPESPDIDAYDYVQVEMFGAHHLDFDDGASPARDPEPEKKPDPGATPRFCCEVCGKKFAFKSRLHEHEKIHFDIRLFTCKVCGKKFVTKTNLVHHSRIHSGDRPYKCDDCDQHFNRSDVLRIHWKRKHSKSRPYECDVCRKSFAMKYLLQTHVKIHLDERPYACDVCGRGFVTKSNMTQHAKTHENDSKRGKGERTRRKKKT